MAKLIQYQTAIVVTDGSNNILQQYSGSCQLDFTSTGLIQVFCQGTKTTFPARTDVTNITDSNGDPVTVPSTDALYAALVTEWFRSFFFESVTAGWQVGEVKWLAWTVQPSDPLYPYILPCEAQELDVDTYAILHSRIGYTYGTGITGTFKLPDLQGRTIGSTGRATETGTVRALGAAYGAETVTLSVNQLPAHQHNVLVQITGTADSPTPEDGYLAPTALSSNFVENKPTGADAGTMGADMISPTGDGAAVSLSQPTLTLQAYIRIL